MQRGAAMEMLCFDQKMGAEEALRRGLVTNVFPHQSFKEECMRRLNLFATKPSTTLEATKKLIRKGELEQLLRYETRFRSSFEYLTSRFEYVLQCFTVSFMNL